MENSARSVVEKMFAAFGKGDVEKFVETVSEDTLWIYHGTQVIPRGTYEGKGGVRSFISNILNSVEVLSFEPLETIVEGEKVVVLGQEHQRVKRSGREIRQKWVQVYTVDNGLISKMEEFATTEAA